MVVVRACVRACVCWGGGGEVTWHTLLWVWSVHMRVVKVDIRVHTKAIIHVHKMK